MTLQSQVAKLSLNWKGGDGRVMAAFVVLMSLVSEGVVGTSMSSMRYPTSPLVEGDPFWLYILGLLSVVRFSIWFCYSH